MGIQTGSKLAETDRPIIDPAKLNIVAYSLKGPLLNNAEKLLSIQDIREISDLGIIVDSSDEFIETEDVIKINDVVKQQFELIGMPVVNEKRSRLGRVIDFTIETGGFYIQQLTVKRPLFRSFNDTELLIHRTQIIEINDKAIVVHSEAKSPEPELKDVMGSYVNPFRKGSSATQEPNSASVHQTTSPQAHL